jgi:CHASE3 domain sensor protein
MSEIIDIKSKLDECRRHSDNHRRSRDYHKEQAAKFRQELAITSEIADRLQDRLDNKEAEIGRWSTALFIIGVYAIAMTVLFAWIVRL